MTSPAGLALHLPGGLDGPGFLCLGTGEHAVAVRLSPRLTSVLVHLAQARARQAGWPAESRGWMSAAQLSKAMSSGDKDYPLDAATVQKYVGRITRAVRAKLPADADPRLLERSRSLGYRLAVNLDLICEESPAAPKERSVQIA